MPAQLLTLLMWSSADMLEHELLNELMIHTRAGEDEEVATIVKKAATKIFQEEKSI